MQRKNKIVFVTGCFDRLLSMHVAFLKEASQYRNVHIGHGAERKKVLS